MTPAKLSVEENGEDTAHRRSHVPWRALIKSADRGKMNNEKVFIIGDIHGCLAILKRLMGSIPWHPNRDRLIFIGDYIDRGEDPKGVVDYILALKSYSPFVQCLVGNQEVMFLDYLNGKDQELYFLNGGWHTAKSNKIQDSSQKRTIPQEHMAFFRSLERFIELDGFYIVHAGFRPGVALEKQSLEDLVWIRDPFLSSEYGFGKRVIFGHTPFDEPLVMENKIGIDTSAVQGNKLTCLEPRD
jgi:serine/threonine protein phosphatase 1